MDFYPKHIVAADARSISELTQLKHGQRVKVGDLIVTLRVAIGFSRIESRAWFVARPAFAIVVGRTP